MTCISTYRMVIETLTGVDPSRKCFRMIGGVLVERTVREVLPALTTNRDQVSAGRRGHGAAAEGDGQRREAVALP